MKTYKIKLSETEWIEQFFGKSIMITDNKNRAGNYTERIAVKRMSDKTIDKYELIENK
jgi:hypothetical protein